MADHHHHHYPSEPLPDEIAKPFGALIVTVIGSILGYKFLMYLSDWESFGAPYKYTAAFYYYTLTVPLMFAKTIWYQVTVVGYTQYPNINYVLGFLAEFIYIILILILIAFISEAFNAVTKKPKRKVIYYFFLPAIFTFIWYMLAALYSWLLAT